MILKRLFVTLFFIFFILYSYSQNESQDYTVNRLDSVFQSNLKTFKSILTSDIDKLIINDCNLNDIETQLNYFEYFGLERFFDFKNQNQIQLYQNFKNLIIEIKQNRTVINQQISNIDYWYYKTAKNFLFDSDTASALEFLDKSLQFNYLYIPAVGLRASLLNNKNNAIEASVFLRKLANVLFTDNDNYRLLYIVVNQINNALAEKSDYFYKTGYYNESMMYYQYADSLCNAFRFSDCKNFSDGILNSKKGIYKSYLRIANQAISTNNFNISESFTDKALEYAIANRDALSDDNETDKNYKLIVSKYLSFSDKYKRNNNNKSAVLYWQKANRICQLLKIQNCNNQYVANNENIDLPDTIEMENTAKPEIIVSQPTVTVNKIDGKEKNKKSKQKIKVINSVKSNKQNKKQKNLNNVQSAISVNLIEIGNDLYSKSKYEDAYQKYLSAKELIPSDKTTDKLKIDIYLKQTAEKIISKPLKEIQFVLWSDDFTKADSILQICSILQEKYFLIDNAEINAELNKIREDKNRKQCNNADEKISLLCKKAFSLFELKEFQKVQSIVDEIGIIKNNFKNCNLNLLEYNKISTLIMPVTLYFNLKNSAKVKYETLKYEEFTNLFLIADSVYQKSRLDSLLIPDNNLISFLKYQNNNENNFQITEYLLLKKHMNECFQLLNVLRENNFPAVNTKKVQEDLVKLVAENNQLDLVYLNIKHPFLKDEKWYKYFIKSYNVLKKNK